MRPGFTTTSLVKQDNPVSFRIEIAPMRRFAGSAWATVKKNNRNTFLCSTFFYIKFMNLVYLEAVGLAGKNRGE
jgi:hypothetical protein